MDSTNFNGQKYPLATDVLPLPAGYTANYTANLRKEIKDIGVGEHAAKVIVLLDISYSMEGDFANGNVENILEQASSLAGSFDDNGELDIFTFGQKAIYRGSVKPQKVRKYVNDMVEQGGYSDFFESQTNYAEAFKAPVEYFFSDSKKKPELPVFCLFITDGDCTPNKKDLAKKALKDASKYPIFYKALAVGLKRDENTFVQQLDDLEGRKVDNFDVVFKQEGDFSITPEELLREYRGFLIEAKKSRMFSSDPKIDPQSVAQEGRVQSETGQNCGCVIS